MSRFRIGVAAVLALLLFDLPARAQGAPLETSTLTIDTQAGPRRFQIEVARTPAQQEVGLMFRRSLPPDAGMLFDLGDIRPAVFWMKNTFIPLDMLFIAADGRIADIHEHAVPMSEAPIRSAVPVRAVLEVNGGLVAALGIKPGDVVHNPLFGNGS